MLLLFLCPAQEHFKTPIAQYRKRYLCFDRESIALCEIQIAVIKIELNTGRVLLCTAAKHGTAKHKQEVGDGISFLFILFVHLVASVFIIQRFSWSMPFTPLRFTRNIS